MATPAVEPSPELPRKPKYAIRSLQKKPINGHAPLVHNGGGARPTPSLSKSENEDIPIVLPHPHPLSARQTVEDDDESDEDEDEDEDANVDMAKNDEDEDEDDRVSGGVTATLRRFRSERDVTYDTAVEALKTPCDLIDKRMAVRYLTERMGSLLAPEHAHLAFTTTPARLRSWLRAGHVYHEFVRFLCHGVDMLSLSCFQLSRFLNTAEINTSDQDAVRSYGILFGYEAVRVLTHTIEGAAQKYFNATVTLLQTANIVFKAWDEKKDEKAEVWGGVFRVLDAHRSELGSRMPWPTADPASSTSIGFIKYIANLRKSEGPMITALWKLRGEEAFTTLLKDIMKPRKHAVKRKNPSDASVMQKGLTPLEIKKFPERLLSTRTICRDGFKFCALRKVPLLNYSLQGTPSSLSMLSRVFAPGTAPITIQDAFTHEHVDRKVIIQVQDVANLMIEMCEKARIGTFKSRAALTLVPGSDSALGTSADVVRSQIAALTYMFYVRTMRPDTAIMTMTQYAQNLYENSSPTAPKNIFSILSHWQTRLQLVPVDSSRALSLADLYLYLVPTESQPMLPKTSYEWHQILQLLTVNNNAGFAPLSGIKPFEEFGAAKPKQVVVGFKLPDGPSTTGPNEAELKQAEAVLAAVDKEDDDDADSEDSFGGIGDVDEFGQEVVRGAPTTVSTANETTMSTTAGAALGQIGAPQEDAATDMKKTYTKILATYLKSNTCTNIDEFPHLAAACEKYASCIMHSYPNIHPQVRRFLAGHENACLVCKKENTRLKFKHSKTQVETTPHTFGAVLAAHWQLPFDAINLEGPNTKTSKYEHVAESWLTEEEREKHMCVNPRHWAVKVRTNKQREVAAAYGLPIADRRRRQMEKKKAKLDKAIKKTVLPNNDGKNENSGESEEDDDDTSEKSQDNTLFTSGL